MLGLSPWRSLMSEDNDATGPAQMVLARGHFGAGLEYFWNRPVSAHRARLSGQPDEQRNDQRTGGAVCQLAVLDDGRLCYRRVRWCAGLLVVAIAFAMVTPCLCGFSGRIFGARMWVTSRKVSSRPSGWAGRHSHHRSAHCCRFAVGFHAANPSRQLVVGQFLVSPYLYWKSFFSGENHAIHVDSQRDRGRFGPTCQP